MDFVSWVLQRLDSLLPPAYANAGGGSPGSTDVRQLPLLNFEPSVRKTEQTEEIEFKAPPRTAA